MPSLCARLPSCSLAAAPATGLLTGGSGSPLHQCMAVNAWIQLFLGLLLPLFSLMAVEQQARRMFDHHPRRQAERQAQPGQPWPGWQAQLRHESESTSVAASSSRGSTVQLRRRQQWFAEGRGAGLMLLGLRTGDSAAAGEEEAEEEAEESITSPLAWAVQLYFSSCTAWVMANVLFAPS